MREAANASQLRRNFEDSSDLYVPQIYWDYVRKNVLVMERIYGTSIRDIEALRQQNTDMERLAALGVEIFFTQVFTHNFFHADMHPGNIFVDIDNPAMPKYIAVDFGIIGTLSQTDKRYLAENFLAFFQRIFEKPLKEISFGQLLLRLFQTARRFDMEVQPQLVLLQKTLLNIEGLGRQLYPDLDLWKTAKPFLERWMEDQIGARALLRNLKDDLPYLIEKMPEMPGLIYKSLKVYSDGEYHLKQVAEIKKIRDEIKQNNHRSVTVLSGTGLIVSASIIYTTAISVPVYLSVPIASWALAVTGALLIVYGLRR